VIVDEVHAVSGTKRGAHLAVSLERLDELLEQPAQRIGLSATVRPIDEVARFLGGTREVVVVQPPSTKTIEVSGRRARSRTWPRSASRPGRSAAGRRPAPSRAPRSGRPSRSGSSTWSSRTAPPSSSATAGGRPSG
jgi:ATP-dependent helicase YprA (DUF1998 family)